MTATERVHRHRQRLRDERAEKERIAETYFGGRPPLSQQERRRLLREMGWLRVEGMIYGRLTQGPLGAAPPPNLSMFCFVPILLI